MLVPHRLAARRAAPRSGAAPAGIIAGAALAAWLLLAAYLVPAQGQTASPAQGAPLYSSAQLDQMLAPIALYPDDLLGQILMAATYPLEVVQADRWLQVPANASLSGMELAQALQQQTWDASVKALVAFPQVLGVMDSNLQWTEELGEAFLAQQADVMDRVQQLRSRARAAGTLGSSAQQMVADSGNAIEIYPPGPDTVYVPVYDPDVIYGEWPYPDYLPFYFDVPGFALGSFIGFAIVAPLWGWNHWDWSRHRINIGGGFGPSTGGRYPSMTPGPWRYDPGHRGGVPYRNRATQSLSGGTAGLPSTRGSFRGFPSSMSAPAPSNLAAPRAPMATLQAPRIEEPRVSPGPAERPIPPAMESFGRGDQVRSQEQRGASSRMSAPSGGGKVHR